MERHFSEQQVGDIIKRAAEHHLRQRAPQNPAPDGVTETELRSVANELGIPSEALDKALSEIASVSHEDSGNLK